jgi:hypothetical protein
LYGGYNNYYREVDGVRWPIHQDVDPKNPLGVERWEDIRPTRGDSAFSLPTAR